jgi:two-component system repressor protein LuxO
LTHAETGVDALTYLQQTTPAVILLDLGHPDNGMRILEYVQQQQLSSKVIVITANYYSVKIVIETMRYSAFDVIEKPCKHNRLIVTLRNALHQYHLSQKVEFQGESCKRQQYHSFVGSSKPMQTVYQTIDNVATSKASILITGETGTGKELCAEAIHKESQQADKPFVVCNCTTIPENLRESFLFGHVKGAFTGASENRNGLVSQADGGTLFLDEIGELPLAMQSTLLRFMQTKTFSKVGSQKVEKVDVRLICATNRNLSAEVKAGQFRDDLYHRLNTIEMKLPALRERGPDILRLAKFFLHKFAKEEQKDFQGFSAEAEKKLLSYKWLGNVRELQNTTHNVVILNKGKVITAEMLRAKINKNISDKNTPLPTESTQPTESVGNHSTIAIISDDTFRPFKDIEKEVIVKAIEYCDGNVVKAAKLLKISKSYIYKLKKLWQEGSGKYTECT